MIDVIDVSLRQSLANLWAAVLSLGPRLVVGLLLAGLGYLVARLLAWVTAWSLSRLRLDRLAEHTSVAGALRMAELPSSQRLCASAVFWIVWLLFLAEAVAVLQVPGFEHARVEAVLFLGRLARALVLLVIGVVIANVTWRATLLAAFNAGWPSARLLAAGLRVLVLAVAILTALAHLGIPLVIVLTAFSIAFGALMLGLALAFGLGGRDAAREVIARHLTAADDASRDGPSHL
jgi:hypothetical protein